MRPMIPSPPPLLLLQAAAFILLLFSSSASSATCPYDFPTASILIPSACYANYSSSSSAPPTNCCQYVFAAYIFSAIRYSNLSGAAFLPSPTAASCSNAFANYLLRHGLVRPSLIRTSDQCNLNGDPDQFAAGKRACQYSTVSAIRSAVNLSSGIHLCTAVRWDLLSDQPSCTACQNSVIASTMSLLKTTASKEFVPCGMATTIGIWSSDPEIGRFRSFALCMVQVLDNVGSLSTANLLPSPALTSTNKTTLPRGKFSNKARVIASTTAAGSGVLFVAIFGSVFILVRRWKRKKNISLERSNSTGDRTARVASQLPTEGLYIFTKSELKHATNGFHPSLVLGEGGAGKVYLGKLPSGQHVAVKRISQKKKIDEFYREVEILAKLRHRNLTTLVGYCLQRKDHVLVYEYMSGGNLGHALHHGELTWPRRVQIAVDIAEGLAYLHEFPDGAVVHRDVKPTNILLNESGSAKLSDFGVSKILPSEISHVSTAVIRGTRGYVDPESFLEGHVSEATDVFSFGIVLLELISGMRAVVPTPSGGAQSIVYSAHELMMEGGGGEEPDVWRIADPRLGPGVEPVSVMEVFKVAYRCVKPYKSERPKMKEVLGVLKRVVKGMEWGSVVGSTVQEEPVGPTTSDEFASNYHSPVSKTFSSG
ncbi:hypothetical protein MRB53_033053 [Persea americana]|uniref:Uncharacterized protein n=1 Tax=Persea americana TaxID=3435 RepID=A0ACC2KU62_PERAE|nr:hypothetical protein MRB53_033053 [Persea americana]